MEIKSVIEEIYRWREQHHQLIHASNILRKCSDENGARLEAIEALAVEYLKYLKGQFYLKGFDKDVVNKRVRLLNEYYNFYDNSTWDYNRIFSAQGKLRSTILEEFMFLLFKNYLSELQKKIDDKNGLIGLGATKAYTHLYFSPLNMGAFVADPSIKVNVKDQDFAIYRDVSFIVGETAESQRKVVTKVPILATEVKTYLDKTMLEGVVATAEKIKMGNPYARIIVVTESYQVSTDVDPSYSQISQIYVLRKCGSMRRIADVPDISDDVVWRLFRESVEHIERPWSDVQTKLENDGVII